MDIFDQRNASPMLLHEERQPFDSPDFLYELKLDGSRCLAYIDPDQMQVDLRNKRKIALLSIFPELHLIYTQVKGKCILDGELIIIENGKPNFEVLQSRSMITNPFKIELVSKKWPACYVAFDILYKDGEELIMLPIEQRKKILSDTVSNNDHIAVSRVIEEKATLFFDLTKRQGLEGIVAKRKGSHYFYGKRSKDWIKIKNLIDEDFLACGYIDKENGIYSLVLGQYEGGVLVYKGHVTLGVTREKVIQFRTTYNCPFQTAPAGNDQVIWFNPPQECTVVYMEKTSMGGMRQPRFKGFRV